MDTTANIFWRITILICTASLVIANTIFIIIFTNQLIAGEPTDITILGATTILMCLSLFALRSEHLHEQTRNKITELGKGKS